MGGRAGFDGVSSVSPPPLTGDLGLLTWRELASRKHTWCGSGSIAFNGCVDDAGHLHE